MFKAVDKWLLGYLKSVLSRPRAVKGTRHLFFCICDHFEPFRGESEPAIARQTVRDWLTAYPAMADSFRDADGRPPCHTFFYPQEEYDAVILNELADFCKKGYGEVEIHLHHRHDTPDGFREKLVTFRDLLHEKHGLLGVERGTVDKKGEFEQKHAKIAKEENCISATGGEETISLCASRASVKNSSTSESESSSPRYGFIHGNWALCNARPDGDWCGVNEELGILAETGCYADFTFPSAPSPTQPRMVNSIYYASDLPGKPRGADKGEIVQAAEITHQSAGKGAENEFEQKHTKATKKSLLHRLWRKNILPSLRSLRASVQNPPFSLLLITGPLALNWCRRKWGILPRLENAELSGVNPPTADRIRLWVRQHIHVKGRPEWVFVKLHTHGCVPANQAVLLGQAMRNAHEILQHEFNDGKTWQLHYVSAREMANIVKAAEANLAGTPGQFRDFHVGPPPYK